MCTWESLSSNVSYWRVRFEPDPWSGEAERVMVVYKTTESGPPDPSGYPTTTWRDKLGVNNPENGLVGIQYIGDNDVRYFPLRVSAEQGKDGIYRNTALQGLEDGELADIGTHLIGWEWDAMTDNGKTPPGITTLAGSPTYGGFLIDDGRRYEYREAIANVTRYTAPSGAIIFATGTNNWSWGLAVYEPNRIIQQVTVNMLADMGVFPATPSATLVLDTASGEQVLAGNSSDDALSQSDAQLSAELQNLLRSWAVSDFTVETEQASDFILISQENQTGPDPTISDLQIQSGMREAVVTWQTDIPADGGVWVKLASGPVDWQIAGTSPGARPIAAEVFHETLMIDHSLIVYGLQPDTQYYYHVVSRDSIGRTTISEEHSFTTLKDRVSVQRVKELLRPAYRQVHCATGAGQATLVGIGAGIILSIVFISGIILLFRHQRKQADRN